MDSLTWLFTLISLALLNFSLFTFGTRCLFWWGPALINLVPFLGTVLSQGVSLPRKINSQGRFVFALWILVAIVIANGYSGILSSLMTKPINPPYPGNMAELVDWPTYTIGSISDVVNDVGVASPLVPSIFPNSSVCKVCPQIFPRIAYIHHYLDGSLWTLRNHIFKGRPIISNLGHTSFSSNFALIEEGDNAPYYFELYRALLEDEKVTIDGGEIPELVSFYHSFVDANYIYKLIHHCFPTLTESGVYDKWHEIHDIFLRINVCDNYYHRHTCLIRALFNFEEMDEEPKPLSMNLLSIPLTVLSLCIGISSIAFQLELITHFFYLA